MHYIHASIKLLSISQGRTNSISEGPSTLNVNLLVNNVAALDTLLAVLYSVNSSQTEIWQLAVDITWKKFLLTLQTMPNHLLKAGR